MTLALRLHAALPQTQCTRCGFADCLRYAQAIAGGTADINQCPPGGVEGIGRLAALTGRAVLPLNPVHGREGPRQMAVIDENWCIGCTLCLDVCPTDAILGSNKHMHTVIERYCTGCELCIPVCPVDCIGLENVTNERTGWAAWSATQADEALDRYAYHSMSRSVEAGSSLKTPKDRVEPEGNAAIAPDTLSPGEQAPDDERKRAVIAAALARARARQTPHG